VIVSPLLLMVMVMVEDDALGSHRPRGYRWNSQRRVREQQCLTEPQKERKKNESSKRVTFPVTLLQPAALGLSVVGKHAKIFPPKVDPKFFLPSSHHIASIHIHSAVINDLSTCPQTRTRVFHNKTQLPSITAYPPRRRTQQTSSSEPLSRSADPPFPRPSETGQSTSTAPSCPGSPLPQLLQQSHQQVNGYICVICISHPTQTTSDTSRLSSCNHFAYRGNLVAPTSVVTANTSPPRRMSR